MKIQYREPTLIEQMVDAIAISKRPIDHFELTQKEFQTVVTSLDKNKSGNTITYSFKGITVKVADE